MNTGLSSPADVAAQVTDRIIESSFASPITLVKAPPGAGKSYLVALIAGAHAAGNGERVAIATPTRAQGADVALDISAAYRQVPVHWHAPKDRPLGESGGIIHTPKPAGLPEDEHIAVGTLAKWANYPVPGEGEPYPYDLLIIDEIYQVTAAALTSVAHLAPRIVAVGDPGQIAPVVTAPLPEYGGRFASPAAAAPGMLLDSPVPVAVFELPATRRFGPETARLLSGAFYDFEFTSIAPARVLTVAGQVLPEFGASLLPGAAAGARNDPALTAHIAHLADTILDTGVITDPQVGERAVEQVYIVCAHIDQVTAVRAATAHLGQAVTVDTAERLQGRQADVCIFWHPAATGPTVTDFQRDTGRLCVMLSRHRTTVIMAAYQNILERLGTYTSPGRSVTGETASWDSYTGTLAATQTLLGAPIDLGQKAEQILTGA